MAAPEENVRVVEDPATDPEVAELADDYARRFLADGAGRMREHERMERKFRLTIRRHWGQALDKYMLTWMAVYDLGDEVNTGGRSAASARQDFLFDVLVRLHTRACQASRSVHHLLTGGYVDDALARCRTLHEISVVAQVLGEYGREPEYPDLAERFLLHHIVMSADDADQHHRHRRALGHEPLDARWLTDIRTARDHLLARFGRAYGGDYGWAVGLPLMKKDADFTRLVTLADVEHLHPYYRWACHHIHADSKSAAFASPEVAEGTILHVGPTTSGLTEPASWALRALCWCTESMVRYASPPSDQGYLNGEYLIWMYGIHRLLDQAEDAFETGNDAEQRAVARNYARIRSGGSSSS